MSALALEDKVKLIPSARVAKDKVTGKPVLLYPEGLLWLNETAVEILSLCDRPIAISSIVEILAEKHRQAVRDVIEKDTIEFLDTLFGEVLIQVVES